MAENNTTTDINSKGEYSEVVPVKVRKNFFLAACAGHKEKISKYISNGISPNYMFTWKAKLISHENEPGETPSLCSHGTTIEMLRLVFDLYIYLGDEEGTDPDELTDVLCAYEPISRIMGQFDGNDCPCLQEETHSPSETVTVGFNILHLFATFGRNDMIDWYHKTYKCDVDIPTPVLHYTPLHHAVFWERLAGCKTVSLLASLGADINAKNSLNETAMNLAVRGAKVEVIEKLVDLGYNFKDFQGKSPLICVANRPHGDPSLFRRLIESGAIVENSTGCLTLCLKGAICHGNVEIVQLLVENGADVNSSLKINNDMTPLILAVSYGSKDICEVLLKNGADPNATDGSGVFALFHAAWRGFFDITMAILQNPATEANKKTAKTCYTALHQAAWEGHLDIVKALLEKGVPHDDLTNDGNTPLSLAAHGNELEIVKYLLPLGCNVNNADKDLDTPMIYASYNGSVDMMKELVNYGADPHCQNGVTTTPLWNAAFKGDRAMVHFLLQFNVSLDIPSVGIEQDADDVDVQYIYEEPHTPLYVSIEQQHFEISRLLVQAGCSLSDWWSWNDELKDCCEDDMELFNWIGHKVTNVDSLKTLCRNFVRKTEGRHLSENITQLELPQSLIEYLLLKRD